MPDAETFRMGLRQTTGSVESLLRLVGLDWTVPDFSNLSPCHKALAVTIPYRGSQGLGESADRLSGHCSAIPCRAVDSTGINAEDEGRWARANMAARDGVYGIRSTSGIDEHTLKIRAMEITGSNVGDAPMLPKRLNQIPADVETGTATADGP